MRDRSKPGCDAASIDVTVVADEVVTQVRGRHAGHVDAEQGDELIRDVLLKGPQRDRRCRSEIALDLDFEMRRTFCVERSVLGNR